MDPAGRPSHFSPNAFIADHPKRTKKPILKCLAAIFARCEKGAEDRRREMQSSSTRKGRCNANPTRFIQRFLASHPQGAPAMASTRAFVMPAKRKIASVMSPMASI